MRVVSKRGLFRMGWWQFQLEGGHACYRDGRAIALGEDGWQQQGGNDTTWMVEPMRFCLKGKWEKVI